MFCFENRNDYQLRWNTANSGEILLNSGLDVTARDSIMPFIIPFKNNISHMWEIKSVMLGKSSHCQNGNRNEIQLPIFYVTHSNSQENIKGNWKGDYLVKCFHNIIIVLITLRKICTILQKNNLKLLEPQLFVRITDKQFVRLTVCKINCIDHDHHCWDGIYMLTSVDFPHVQPCCGDRLRDRRQGWERCWAFCNAVEGNQQGSTFSPFFSEQPHSALCPFPARDGAAPP